jgi:hypothetical protein
MGASSKRRLHWAGLALGFLGAVAALVLMLPPVQLLWGRIPNDPSTWDELGLKDWLQILAPGLIAIASVAIARKWLFIGGILLVAEGAFWSGGILLGGRLSYDYSFLVPGVLMVASGILLLVSWRAEQSLSYEIP